MRSIHRNICLATLFLIALINTGCDSGAVSTPESFLYTKNSTPDIRGEISDITKIDDTVYSIHVKGEIQTDTRFDEAGIKLTDNTRIYAATVDGYEIVTSESLKIGQTVECLFLMGTILERSPIVGEAQEIFIKP